MNPKLPEHHCPLCGKDYKGYPAVSRYDNKTEVCSDCGLVESFGGPIIVMCRVGKLSFREYAKHMLTNYTHPMVVAILEVNRQAMKLVREGKFPGQGIPKQNPSRNGGNKSEATDK